MSKWDKLISRIYSSSKDMRFSELRKILESCGYTMNAPRGGSSHYTFRKRVYVEMVRKVVEETMDEND